MAEAALISLTSKILITVATPAFEKAYKRVQSINRAPQELEDLRLTIESIQAVLLDAEKRQEGSAAVKNWMKRARDVLYDADDLFDEVATIDLLKQQMKGNALSKQVGIFTSKLNSIVSSDSIAKKVKAIREALQRISDDMGSIGFLKCVLDEKPISMSKEVMGAFVDPNKVIGREVEKEVVLKFLFDESNAKESLSVFAVVGIGGMGKTTLAQLIYNDNEVERRFKYRWWACISDIADEKEILEKISQSMGAENPKNYDACMLQSKISNIVRSVGKYLLVLDDVWIIADSSPTLWLNIMSLLEYGAQGSKVVVTTRFSSVPRLMLKDKSEVFELEGLSNVKSWELFSTIAFTREQENDREWIGLGRSILNKCSNVPLAIKSIATILRGKVTKKEWESIKNEKLLNNGTTMSALKLSYHHLPSYLKPCFAYCSLFPKDSLIDKDRLVYQWIALGYVTPKEGETLEAAGHCYSMDLLNRSFFQLDTERTYSDGIYYKMHDLVHDLAENVAGKENSIVVEGSNIILHNRIRHLRVIYKRADELRLSIPSLINADRLRTFLFEGGGILSPPVVDQGITKFKLLRILCLRNKNVEIVPDSVGELLHLRHLDLSWNNFKSLPNSITKLVNLITLKLNGCIRLLTLPDDVCKLLGLRHLDNTNCSSLRHMPPDLGKLSQLQSLSCFKAGGAVNGGKRSSLVELARLNISGKLRIEIGNGDDGEECWQVPTGITDVEIQSVEGIRIPQYKIPFWPNNLVRLHLENCSTIKHLPPLRCLLHLKTLTLWRLNDLEHVEDNEDGQQMNDMSIFFPCLNELHLHKLPKLKKWSREVVDRTIICKKINVQHDQFRNPPSHPQKVASFPLLQQLRVCHCPELVSMPLAPQLLKLKLKQLNEELIQQMFLSFLSSLESLEIEGCDRLKTLSSEVLTSLRHLSLTKCPSLKKLHNTSSKLNNLEELKIYQCPNLESWEKGNSGVDWESLPSLCKLILTEVPNTDKLPQCLLQRQVLGKLQIEQDLFSILDSMINEVTSKTSSNFQLDK